VVGLLVLVGEEVDREVAAVGVSEGMRVGRKEGRWVGVKVGESENGTDSKKFLRLRVGLTEERGLKKRSKKFTGLGV